MSANINTGIILQGPLLLSDFQILKEESDFKLPEVEALEAEIWASRQQEAKLKGKKVWNGKIYRLNNVEEVKHGAKTLSIGIVNYSYILAANQYIKESDALIQQRNYTHYMFTPIVAETTDQKIIVGVKDVNTDKQDLPGGFLQADELEVNEAKDIERNAFKELKEEFGIESEHVASSILLGIGRSLHTHLPFVFNFKLNLSSTELPEIFNHRTESEMQDFKLIDKPILEEYLLRMGNSKLQVWELVSRYWASQ